LTPFPFALVSEPALPGVVTTTLSHHHFCPPLAIHSGKEEARKALVREYLMEWMRGYPNWWAGKGFTITRQQ
jgi:hypothetical protein